MDLRCDKFIQILSDYFSGFDWNLSLKFIIHKFTCPGVMAVPGFSPLYILDCLAPVFQSGKSDQLVGASSVLELEVKKICF